jgi:hypothetical protein
LQQLLTRALQATAALWPPLEHAYALVHQAAHLLANHEQRCGAEVQAAYRVHLMQMEQQKSSLGRLSTTIDHFLHITDNFAPGLFHCYDVADLPHTNNDLEHCFGIVRVHERRATGRRGAIPGLVVRGSVRVLAALVTKVHPVPLGDLQLVDYQAWRRLRKQLQYRQEARRQQWRFRKNSQGYLAALEQRLLQ